MSASSKHEPLVSNQPPLRTMQQRVAGIAAVSPKHDTERTVGSGRSRHAVRGRSAGQLLSVTASLLCGLGLLAVLGWVSLFIGSKFLTPSEVFAVLIHPDDSLATSILWQQRIPRLVLVIVVGCALGVAGALMQSMTRNPLADPGILGIHAGAALAVVCAVAFFSVTSLWGYIGFACIGAALAAAAVAVLGGMQQPAKLALAGMALTMTVSSFVQVILLLDQRALNEFRFWVAGSVEGRGMDVASTISIVVAVGLVLAMMVSGGLNALALGEDTSRALGVRVRTVRAVTMLAVTLLAGAATAAAGPIMFVGLAVPYLARLVTGPDMRTQLPLSAVLGPIVLLVADLCARVVVAPQEIQTGIVTALIGGPVFIAVVRRRNVVR